MIANILLSLISCFFGIVLVTMKDDVKDQLETVITDDHQMLIMDIQYRIKTWIAMKQKKSMFTVSTYALNLNGALFTSFFVYALFLTSMISSLWLLKRRGNRIFPLIFISFSILGLFIHHST